MPIAASPATRAKARTSRDMVHDSPIGVYAPALDGVVVVEGVNATCTNNLVVGWLHVAGLVHGAALQHGRAAVPAPGQAEARERLRQDWLLQSGFLPTLSPIDRYVHTPNPAVARPGQARDLDEARTTLDLVTTRGPRDHRLRFHEEGELARRAIRHEVRVFRGLFTGLERPVAELQPAQPFNVYVALEAR